MWKAMGLVVRLLSDLLVSSDTVYHFFENILKFEDLFSFDY